IARDVQLVWRLIVDAKKLPLDTARLHPHQSPIAADAMRHVDDQISLLQLEERHDRPALFEGLPRGARPGPGAPLAEDLRICEDDQLDAWKPEPGAEPALGHVYQPAVGVLRPGPGIHRIDRISGMDRISVFVRTVPIL